MQHQQSIIRASYNLTILRVARSANGHEAFRFGRGLSSEYPQSDTPADLRPLEIAAIDAVEALADALLSSEKKQASAWDRAGAAATAWLNAAT